MQEQLVLVHFTCADCFRVNHWSTKQSNPTRAGSYTATLRRGGSGAGKTVTGKKLSVNHVFKYTVFDVKRAYNQQLFIADV